MIRTVLVLAAGLAAFANAGLAAAEALRVGTECTYAPFNYRTADGKLTGYDVDVATEVGNRIGAQIEFVCQDWDGMIPALLANKFDLIVASMSITDKRLKQIDFSGPYRVSIGQFVGRNDADHKLFNADGSVNATGFEGLRVGLERSSTYEEWMKAKVPSAKVVYYDGNEPMYLDLNAGRVDLIMTNPMKAHLKFLSNEGNSVFGVIGPQLDDQAYFGIGVGVGLRKGQQELRAKIDTALEAMTGDGTLNEFSLRYFPFPIYPKEWRGTN